MPNANLFATRSREGSVEAFRLGGSQRLGQFLPVNPRNGPGWKASAQPDARMRKEEKRLL